MSGLGAGTLERGAAARVSVARGDAARSAGDWAAAVEAYAEAVERVGSGDAAAAVRADARRGAGIAWMERAEWGPATEELRRSREEAGRAGDERRIALAENALGAVAFQRGEWTWALHHWIAARRSAEAVEDRRLLAQIENNVGALWSARGESERAEQCFRRALADFDDLAIDPCAARALNNLGLALAALGRWDQAELAYQRALRESARSGDAAFALRITVNRTRLALLRGRPAEAQRRARQLWEAAEPLGPGPLSAGVTCLLGEAARALRDRVGATSWFRRALAAAAEGKAPLQEAETWVQIGHLYRDQGQRQRAVETWQYARHLYRMLGATAELDRLMDLIDGVEADAA